MNGVLPLPRTCDSRIHRCAPARSVAFDDVVWAARSARDRVDRPEVPIVERTEGVRLDGGFNCRTCTFGGPPGCRHGLQLGNQRVEFIQLDQFSFDLDALDLAAQPPGDVVGRRRGSGLESLTYRTQWAYDLAVPHVDSAPGGTDGRVRQRLASHGTDEGRKQDHGDVQIMPGLQVQARLGHTVASVELQRESRDGPVPVGRRDYRPSQRRYNSWEMSNWSRSLPTVWLSRSSIVSG